MMRLLRFVVGVAAGVVLLGTAASGVAQQSTKGGGVAIPPSQSTPGIRDASSSTSGRIDMDVSSITAGIEEKQLRTRNSERQKRLTADASRLLVLATELKKEMAKPETSAGAVDWSRKAEEIEKLAKSVRERMRG